MTHIILSLIIAGACNFHPTINGERQIKPVVYADLPYLLGVSIPGDQIIDITIQQSDWRVVLDNFQGTNFDLFTITDPNPVYLSGWGCQYKIIPEPATIFLLWGVFLHRKRKAFRK